MPNVQVTELVRVFRHKGEEIKDPAPNLPPERAVELLAHTYPELNNGVVEPPETRDGKQIYPIKTSVGTKG